MLKMIKDIEDIVEVAVEVEAPGEEEEVVAKDVFKVETSYFLVA